MNVPAYPPSTTGLARVAPGLVGFLHFFTLGAALPLLPLNLTRTLGYGWTLTGVILTTIPFSLLIGQIFVRTLSELGIDVRLGLAMSHLLAAGVAMSAGIWLEPSAGVSFNWLKVFGLIGLYFALLAPSMIWIARVGDASTTAGRSVIRSWRVWGAVGFVAPAWLCESALTRFPNLVSAVSMAFAHSCCRGSRRNRLLLPRPWLETVPELATHPVTCRAADSACDWLWPCC